MKPLRCCVGFHKWLMLGNFSLVIPCPVYECLRCHRREARYGYATIYSDAPEGGWTDYVDMNLAAGVRDATE